MLKSDVGSVMSHLRPERFTEGPPKAYRALTPPGDFQVVPALTYREVPLTEKGVKKDAVLFWKEVVNGFGDIES